MLSLSEKLLLLGLHDEKGHVVMSASVALPYGLVGALLLELYLAKRIDFVEKNIQVINEQPTHNALLDETLGVIARSEKLRTTQYWLQKIQSKVDKIQQRLTNQLVEKEVLFEKEHSFMWIINYNRYPTQNNQPELDVRNRIKQIVLDDAEPTEAEIALMSLVLACELIGEIFENDDKKVAKERINALSKGQKISKAVSKTVEEIMVALMVIFTTTAVTATVTS